MKELYRIVAFFFAIQVTIDSPAWAGELGSVCTKDNECNAENSRCYQKQCSCLPFYAVYNSTVCLESNMLGFDCLVAEQCSKKVANSNCIGGICRCEPGFLQFRRHTCLTAAKVGDICYNDMHCRLWDNDSRCDFVIANLFGRCICNAPLKRSRSRTCEADMPPPTITTTPSLDFSEAVLASAFETKAPVVPAKVQGAQLKPQNKIKPDHKPLNKTDPTKPPKIDTKPSTKPERPHRPINTKPEKPTKKPDHKFSLNQLLNKTQHQLGQLSDKIASFYPVAVNVKPLKPQPKPVKGGTSTEKPRPTTTSKSSTTISPTTTTTPIPSTPKPKSPPKTETLIKPPETSAQPDKMFVVHNSAKKPTKNKLSTSHKAPAKNPLQTSLPFLGNRDNVTAFEDSLHGYLSNLNKQMETALAETSQKGFLTNESVISAVTSLHLRGAEDISNRLSLGYPCKLDAQCMRNDNNSRCINGVCDCIARRTRLDNTCSARNRGCHKGTFQCKSSGACVSWFFVCDGKKDCSDGSDENCKGKNTCPDYTFRCGSSIPAICVSQASRCDRNVDCPNGEDEHNCTATKYTDCPLRTFQCEDGRCLPEYEFCNAVISCEDGSDEPDNACTATWNTPVRNLHHCPFRCSNGRCRSSAVVCSRRDGCGDNSDENKCAVCKCPPAA